MDPKCEIFIHTQMSRYMVGDMVEGAVVLVVFKPITVNKILLKWKGANQKKILGGFSEDGKYKGSWNRFGNSQSSIVRVCADISNTTATYGPGTFVFPFQFRSEANMPGSHPLKGIETVFKHLRTIYRLKAEVHGPDYPKVKHSMILDFCEPLRIPIQPAQVMIESPVTSCCCFGKGQVTLTAILDKNAYTHGEDIHALITVDATNCTTDFISSSAHLSSYCVHTDRPLENFEMGILTKIFPVTIPGPAIAKGSKKTFKMIVPVPKEVNPQVFCNSPHVKTIGLNFLYILHSTFVKDVNLIVPITIYGLPVINAPLTVLQAKINETINITPESFRNY